tara:strand:- start:2369 stop:2563 length:195 start_codon:yes stop_codon:yes gene_type:complete
MEELLDLLIIEFKKIKKVRGDLFTNFLSFVQLFLTDKKVDKYKENILKYIVANRSQIQLRLKQN